MFLCPAGIKELLHQVPAYGCRQGQSLGEETGREAAQVSGKLHGEISGVPVSGEALHHSLPNHIPKVGKAVLIGRTVINMDMKSR